MAQHQRRTFRPHVALIGAAVLCLIPSVAQAAAAGESSTGSDPLQHCDTSGVNVAYTTGFDAASGTFTVTAATVSGLADGTCQGSVHVHLLDAAGNDLAAGSAELGVTDDVVVTLDSAAAMELVASVAVSIA